MRARRLLMPVLVATGLAVGVAGPAQALPPEGCYGVPSVPQAFVCIEDFQPFNAVPTLTEEGGQTVTVPEVCVGECYGPTPVTIPGFTVGSNGGSIATVRYLGQDYPVAAPYDAGAIYGLPCRMVAETVAITEYTGVFSAGPFFSRGGDSFVSISCAVQFDQPNFGGTVWGGGGSSPIVPTPYVGVMPATLGAFPNITAVNQVYVCTSVLTRSPLGVQTRHNVDADLSTPGEQCAPAWRLPFFGGWFV